MIYNASFQQIHKQSQSRSTRRHIKRHSYLTGITAAGHGRISQGLRTNTRFCRAIPHFITPFCTYWSKKYPLPSHGCACVYAPFCSRVTVCHAMFCEAKIHERHARMSRQEFCGGSSQTQNHRNGFVLNHVPSSSFNTIHSSRARCLTPVVPSCDCVRVGKSVA